MLDQSLESKTLKNKINKSILKGKEGTNYLSGPMNYCKDERIKNLVKLNRNKVLANLDTLIQKENCKI